MSEKTVLMIGGPLAGKTSFLAKLWLAVEKKTCSIKLRDRGADDQYLREISQRLIAGEFPGRTLRGQRHSCSLQLSTETGIDFNLKIPDLPGESWENLYTRREWSQTFEEAISRDCTILIFVRPDEYVMLLDFTDGELDSSTDVPSAGETPTEVLIVDWLQMLREAFRRNVGFDVRPKVALVLSAWDRVPASAQQNPQQFVQREMPMLSQFVETNSASIDIPVIGLSATGGDLNKDANFKERFEKSPEKFGYLYMPNGKGGYTKNLDITSALQWAIS